jgi:DNA end-binding protein Ku
MVSLPVRLYTAARRERVRMHYVKRSAPEPEGPEPEKPEPEEAVSEEPVTRVRQELTAPAEENPVPRQELLRGYEVAPQKYVTFQQEELRKLRVETSPEMEIVRSVRLAEIDPVYFDTSYYVVPDHGGERAYSLLFKALQETGLVALAKVAMHGREHILVVRPGQKGLLAHTMFYNNEIRANNEAEAGADLAPKELDLAKTFVQAISGPFAPEEFKDAYREEVRKMISGKLERQEVAASASSPQPVAAPVVNVLDALKKSLALAKKPAAKAAAAPKSKAQLRKA